MAVPARYAGLKSTIQSPNSYSAESDLLESPLSAYSRQ